MKSLHSIKFSVFIHFIYAKFQKKKLEIPNTNDSDIFCRSETYILLLERKAKLMIIAVLALLSPCFIRKFSNYSAIMQYNDHMHASYKF